MLFASAKMSFCLLYLKFLETKQLTLGKKGKVGVCLRAECSANNQPMTSLIHHFNVIQKYMYHLLTLYDRNFSHVVLEFFFRIIT